MGVYRIIIKETQSTTAYISARDSKQAEHSAIFNNIQAYENQDFEQEVLSVEEVEESSVTRFINGPWTPVF